MPDPAVRVAVRPDGCAVLTIDQPGAKVNVLTTALWAELEATLDGLAGRSDVAGLVFASGKPGCFIAGADLNLLANATPGDPAVRAFIAQGQRVLAKLEALPFPTCAAIDGVALGGGLEVALACRFRGVGTHPKVQLGLPEVKLGLIPGWGGTQRLPRFVTRDAAARMLFTGDPVSGPEAVELGLADPADSTNLIEWASGFLFGALAFAADLPPGPPPDQVEGPLPPAPDSAAGRELARLIEVAGTIPLAEGSRLETEAFLRLAGSAESRAKIAAFFAARKR